MFFLNAPFSVGLHHLWIRWYFLQRSLAPRHLRCSGTLRLAHSWKLTVDRNVATKLVNFAVRQLEIQQRQNSLSSNRRTCCPMPQVSRLWKQSLKVWLLPGLFLSVPCLLAYLNNSMCFFFSLYRFFVSVDSFFLFRVWFPLPMPFIWAWATPSIGLACLKTM